MVGDQRKERAYLDLLLKRPLFGFGWCSLPPRASGREIDDIRLLFHGAAPEKSWNKVGRLDPLPRTLTTTSGKRKPPQAGACGGRLRRLQDVFCTKSRRSMVGTVRVS